MTDNRPRSQRRPWAPLERDHLQPQPRQQRAQAPGRAQSQAEAPPPEPERDDDRDHDLVGDDGTAAGGGNGAPLREPTVAETGAEAMADPAMLAAERDALLEQVVRARADYANLKRRSEQETAQAQQRAAERILRDLLPVLDDLQDGLGHIPPDLADSGLANGMKLVEQKFGSALARLGVASFDALGEPFDPALHEAVDYDAAGGDKVAAVYRRGYKIGDALLRPAIVKVGPAPPPPEPDPTPAPPGSTVFQD
ncbi:MAG: nucleotide exchange factor GrpE [Chloroflexia bacterium]|nr:nucleotide exchange factor GrpE [Chloroflexia bacterium]